MRGLRYLFFALQKAGVFNKLGLYLMPIHYYHPVPDLKRIKADSSWDLRPRRIHGVDLNEESQLRLLKTEFPKYVDEYDFPMERIDVGNAAAFYFNNHMFANTDAEAYYCMIRHFKPRVIIEVGGGVLRRFVVPLLRRIWKLMESKHKYP